MEAKPHSHQLDNGSTSDKNKRGQIITNNLKPYQEEPLHHQRTTGLTTTQFTALLQAITSHLAWGKPGGKPLALTLS